MAIAQRLKAVEVHAEGEPGRVIVSGYPDAPGKTMLEKVQWIQANADHLRLWMLREPNGYPALCANVLMPPTDPRADAGFFIMEQSEYPPMSGGNTMCVATVLLETGILPMTEPVTEITLEAPAGLVGIRAECKDGKVTRVTVRNVPSFVMHLDLPIAVPEIGTIMVDIAWGGMFYAIADGDALGIDLSASNGSEIARVMEMMRVATVEQHPVAHPLEPTLLGPTISQLSGAPTVPGAHLRNAVTMPTGTLDWNNPATWTGALDRCPCGTGTSAKMAVLHARGELALGEEFIHQGPIDTTFTGRLVSETMVGDYKAVVPEISGQAWITGYCDYVLDDTDPFPNGFTVGDIWA